MTAILSSLLLASADAERLRAWYESAFGIEADPDGFLHLGAVAVLVDPRADVEDVALEPQRVLLTYEVADIKDAARRLEVLGPTWVAPIEYRNDGGAWFGTLADPDGNWVQLIQLTPEYWKQRRLRHGDDPRARGPLRDASCAVRLPAQDLERARRFYAEVLGLLPAEARPGGLRYECGPGSFVLFESAGKASGDHTQMGWYVADLDATVAELRERGVQFEDVAAPGLKTNEGVAFVEGNYPSTGAVGERAAWFHDSEGNVLGIAELVFASDDDILED